MCGVVHVVNRKKKINVLFACCCSSLRAVVLVRAPNQKMHSVTVLPPPAIATTACRTMT